MLLIHGFPELGYSWRHVMLPLAKAGYHVIAPDQRGYGRSGGTDVTFDQDLAPFSTLNRVRDMMALINALGHRSVAMVVGHDFGSPVAGWCALTRPDVFRSVVMMSAPFGGAAPLPFNTRATEPAKRGRAAPSPSLDDELAKLPQPRKHYQTYYTTREANENMWHPPQGIHNFLRAYYHAKSADWAANKPFPLASNSATEMAKLPKLLRDGSRQGDGGTGGDRHAVGGGDRQLQVAHRRGAEGLRVRVWPQRFPGRAAVVSRRPRAAPVRGDCSCSRAAPSTCRRCSCPGKSDWGVYQRAGSLDGMKRACTKFEGVELIDGAGHWVQQEQAAQVAERLAAFLRQHS